MARGRALLDDRGAVSSDWLVLTAGIVLFGIGLTISVMENSSGYLMDEMETLNEQYANGAMTLSELDRPGEAATGESFENN